MQTEIEIDYKAEYIALATRVRRTSQRIIGAVGAGNKTSVLNYAGALCTEMTAIVQGEAMKDESTGEDRYSLAALAVDTTLPTDSESPFESE